MARQLTVKEEKILKRFEVNNPKKINASQVVLQGLGDFYNVIDPEIYEIPGTNTKLVFGDIRKSMGMEEIQKMIEQQMSKNRENAEQTVGPVVENVEENDSREISGEGIVDDEVVEETKTDDLEKSINEDDVKVLMEQTNVSYERAVQVLKQENHDVIKALVELSKGNK